MAFVPFSQCQIWTDHIDFYKNQGVAAWDQKVPYHVTNHMGIAASYAEIVKSYVEEQKDAAKGEPIYVVDLGAGHGRFGHYFLKQWQELNTSSERSIVFVMADFGPANIAFLRSHPGLQPAIKSGWLDFALFDPSEQTSLTLEISGKVLSPSTKRQPPMVFFGNYFFDSLPIDVFHQKDGELTAVLLPEEASIEVDGEMNQAVRLQHTDLEMDYSPVEGPVYDDPEIEGALQQAATRLQDGYFSFPIIGLRCLQSMAALSGGRFLMIYSDKGPRTDYERAKSAFPGIAMHGGGISLAVDFPILAQFIEQQDGSFLEQSSPQNLQTLVCCRDPDLNGLPQTRRAAERALNSHGHYQLFQTYRTLKNNREKIEITAATLLAHLELLRWDPIMVTRLWPAIADALNPGTEAQRDAFAHGIQISASYYHYLPSEDQTILDLASTYFEWLEDGPMAEHFRRCVERRRYIEPDGLD